MHKHIPTAAALALTALFTAACDSGPPARVETDTPAWTQTLDVDRVAKHRSHLTNQSGQEFYIRRTPQDIGGGLTARTRGTYKLYVIDENNVECLWRSDEKLRGCTKPNPALTPGN